jgi:hypothetical protein
MLLLLAFLTCEVVDMLMLRACVRIYRGQFLFYFCLHSNNFSNCVPPKIIDFAVVILEISSEMLVSCHGE